MQFLLDCTPGVSFLKDGMNLSTLDISSGGWKVEVDEAAHDKTPLASHHELNRLVRMPFSLQRAPGTFQNAVDLTPLPVKLLYALV